MEESGDLVGSVFGFGPGDPGSISSLDVVLFLFPHQNRIVMLNKRGPLWTTDSMKKIMDHPENKPLGYSDAIHVKQDDLRPAFSQKVSSIYRINLLA